MIVLGNSEFALGMKFAGVKNSFTIKKREDAIKVLSGVPEDEFIIANAGILEKVPELLEFKNVVTIPDSAKNFGNIEDLKGIIKSVVGIELEVDQ